ncbi:unnamed protein product [Cylicocyclus nassatus]|uniref:Uncharacterized protein n=1 Tax=Cylicocyclus nassatus TaxID=53992 RepID=A0AA36MB64_CYLNA|nr:unnamed protein product [Cylicocyclus nassatus]
MEQELNQYIEYLVGIVPEPIYVYDDYDLEEGDVGNFEWNPDPSDDNSEEQNIIPEDNGNNREGRPVDNRFDGMENNEITLRHPVTGKKWSYDDNRPGWTYQVKGDITTEEGYQKVLQELSEYLGNLTGIQPGPNYIYDNAIDLEEGEIDDFEWYPYHSDDSDYWDSDWENDLHDELK